MFDLIDIEKNHPYEIDHFGNRGELHPQECEKCWLISEIESLRQQLVQVRAALGTTLNTTYKERKDIIEKALRSCYRISETSSSKKVGFS